MQIRFDDSNVRESLYPFTATRNAADIRVGILTIREKWQLLLEKEIIDPAVIGGTLQANFIPTTTTAATIVDIADSLTQAGSAELKGLHYPWEIFQLNDWAMRRDFELITSGRTSREIPTSNKLVAPGSIFIEEGAVVEHCIINASAGPVYIGKNALVMEGCMLRGPVALCEGAVLKMGSRVYGATTIGPFCNAGGEIKNSVMFGYSNKSHDGYLGDSVLGEWCNIGAGTSNSNVLNTARSVKVWNNKTKDYVQVGLKCGLLMGDYSRTAINTSLNTGTTVGVCCNIFGADFPAKLVADFSWGKERYTFDRALIDIDNWKKLKGHHLTETEKDKLEHLYINP